MSNSLTLDHILVLTSILFCISIASILYNRKNLLVILMSIEIMLLAINTNFIAFSYFLNVLQGQIFVIFILTIAAAETSIGLALIVVFYRQKKSIDADSLNQLKG